MSEWIGTTDEDLPQPQMASKIVAAMKESNAGEAAFTWYEDEGGTDAISSLLVAESSDQVRVAVHVDWRTREIVTAWEVEG